MRHFSTNEEDIDISQNKPKLLALEMMEGIDRAIIMGCENSCPVTTVETDDWTLEDPKGKTIEEVRKIRDDIKNRAVILVKEIA